MSVEENREIRPVRKKRKLRWGRLVFVLLVLAVLLTGAFWGTVWIYDNFINPPKVDVVSACTSGAIRFFCRLALSIL